MNSLWTLIAQIACEHQPQRIEQWARQIEQLPQPRSLQSILKGLDFKTATQLEHDWKASNLSGSALGAGLLAAAKTAQYARNQERIELVWTGPTATVPVRHTEQVLLEVIRAATQRLFIVSFVAFKVKSVMQALNDATRNGIQISILLESSQDHGGILNVNAVEAMKTAVPTAFVYVWEDTSKNDYTGSLGGSVHAKCAVADGKTAFITSANLTSAALDRNIEAGLLVYGGEVPKNLDRLLGLLVKSGQIIAK